MRYLTGEQIPFRAIEARRSLVGKGITYLRHTDIDKTGRGYYFPRTAIVVAAHGRQMLLDNGNSISVSDLFEVVLTPEGSGDD